MGGAIMEVFQTIRMLEELADGLEDVDPASVTGDVNADKLADDLQCALDDLSKWAERLQVALLKAPSGRSAVPGRQDPARQVRRTHQARSLARPTRAGAVP